MRIVRCSQLVLLVLLILAVSISSFGAVFISVGIAPPPLPVYEQPYCPAPGYIWTPGYWAYGPDGYFWVPGTWVMAPEVGYLWTPGYWGWGGNAYVWNPGYWGPQVGYYGGINYGYGYYGNGYQGGDWHGRDFYYNRAVNRVNVTNIHNTYNTTMVNNTVNRVSYNGGQGGINARPTAAQEAAARERHVGATSVQTQHEQMARNDRAQWASVNHGRPEVAATPKPTAFHGTGVVAARNAPVTNNPAVRAPQQTKATNPGTPHPGDNNVPHPPERATTANRDNPPHPNTAKNVPHPPTRETEQHANKTTAPRPSETTVAHNRGNTPAAEPAREAPHPQPHVNQPEPAPRGNSAAPRPNEVPHPPEHESTPRSNNAAPRPENPTVVHNAGRSSPSESRREAPPPAHENQPASRVSQPPEQHAAPPHESAPPKENRQPHGNAEPPR